MVGNSNKTQKYIVSIYLISIPVVGFWSSYKLAKVDRNLDPMTIIGGALLVTIPLYIIIGGIIVIILYKIWADKK